MNDVLISMFIDDELDLNEKVEFVETVHGDESFTLEVVRYLNFEKLLQDTLPQVTATTNVNKMRDRHTPHFSWSWRLPATFLTASLILACLGVSYLQGVPEQNIPVREHRFVLYLPQANKAEVIGTFTDWSPVPMDKIGSSGYWTLTLKVPYGEHRYSYVIENETQIIDPTVVARESDDFGGENTVIIVGGNDDSIS